MVNNFIFGYGSLICAESRARTGQSGEAIPVRVNGIERQWNLVAGDMRLTAVGAIANPQYSCNGVLVSVPESELPKFDKREAGYTRLPIAHKDITSLFSNIIPQGNLWVYVADIPGKPDAANPLAQSYIDVILTGCLDISDDFAKEFITSTTGWNNPWINDRKAPRYVRAMSEVPYARKIDTMLKQLVLNAFENRVDM